MTLPELFALNMPAAVAAFLSAFVILLLFIAPIAGLSTYIERKVAADFQERIGPNRVGPLGILQFIADAVKMFLKEDTVPKNADRFVFNLAPTLVMTGSFGAFAAIPFAKHILGADLDIGLFYIMALGSLVSLGILLGAWSSDNKWSLLGGMRGAAQIISYEIPLGITLLTVVTVAGSLSLTEIIAGQAWVGLGGGSFWNVIHNPFIFINFFIYFCSSLAECNRTPFDLPEAESELVSGFNTEFSGMRFGIYALAEFADIILFACVSTAVFFGGWHLPFFNPDKWNPDLGALTPVVLTLITFIIFVTKAAFFVFVVMWLRWTLPRLRLDQLMAMCWKYFIPISFFNLALATLWIWYFNGKSIMQLVMGG